jgi:hypothetical protein
MLKKRKVWLSVYYILHKKNLGKYIPYKKKLGKNKIPVHSICYNFKILVFISTLLHTWMHPG